jgi:hypothetical protein
MKGNLLVFFLEEPSARAMLKGLLPRLLPMEWQVRYVVFEGKQDLEKQLPRKLQAWRLPGCEFVILRDKDCGDCMVIRQRLVEKCCAANKPKALVRIAIHEIESWYLGDLAAVEAGLGVSNLAKKQGSRKFREPDKLANPTQELRRLTSDRYQKVSGSRDIGIHLSIENNRSQSFRKFISGVKNIIT